MIKIMWGMLGMTSRFGMSFWWCWPLICNGSQPQENFPCRLSAQKSDGAVTECEMAAVWEKAAELPFCSKKRRGVIRGIDTTGRRPTSP